MPDEALINRFVEGSRTHATRRIDEMQAAAELLAEVGMAPYMTHATQKRLEELVNSSDCQHVIF